MGLSYGLQFATRAASTGRSVASGVLGHRAGLLFSCPRARLAAEVGVRFGGGPSGMLRDALPVVCPSWRGNWALFGFRSG